MDLSTAVHRMLGFQPQTIQWSDKAPGSVHLGFRLPVGPRDRSEALSKFFMNQHAPRCGQLFFVFER